MYRATLHPDLVYRCEHRFATYEKVDDKIQCNVNDKTLEAVDQSDRSAQDEESEQTNETENRLPQLSVIDLPQTGRND